jgi:NAD(P)-dependent dehydrogenase (short-subunit alcohol dehydrogenase family)
VSSAAFQGRRLVVVGASAGIGRSVGEQAVRAGADVVLVGRRRERLDEIVADIGGGHPVAADLRSADDCAALAEAAVAALGTVDALVVCSGASGLWLLRDTSQADWHSVFDVNVIGPSLVTAGLLPHMAPGGVLAYLSSEAVGRPRHGLVAYSASKAALEETVRGWRAEHPELRFCSVCVGATVGTEFARDFDLELAAELFPAWVAHGHMAASMMPVEQVGSAILTVIGTALAHPEVDVQDVILRPPGPLMDRSAGWLLEAAEASKSAGTT